MSDTAAPSSDPAEEPAPDAAVPERSADDTDLGWGDEDEDDSDERLTREKPPHW